MILLDARRGAIPAAERFLQPVLGARQPHERLPPVIRPHCDWILIAICLLKICPRALHLRHTDLHFLCGGEIGLNARFHCAVWREASRDDFVKQSLVLHYSSSFMESANRSPSSTKGVLNGRAAHIGSWRLKPRSSSLPIPHDRLISQQSELTDISNPHLPSASWTQLAWMRSKSSSNSGVSLRGL